jgi:TorA maturation chaperone TorD
MKSKCNETMSMQTQTPSGIVDRVRDDAPKFSNQRGRGETGDRDQATENQYRAVAYSMLAALLRNPPEQEVLNRVTGLADVIEDKDEFAVAMSMLGLSARAARPLELDDEFHALFIGIGRGELVPYGSWYLTGFLMEKPVGVLRDDLAAIGYQRSDGTREPEDHVAALCEVMALMINDGHSLEQQRLFFDRHIASWFGTFFRDLAEAKSAVFYRSVARFGKAFFDFDKQYLAIGV